MPATPALAETLRAALTASADAWTDADEVRRYVDANAARRSALSKREALKNIARRP